MPLRDACPRSDMIFRRTVFSHGRTEKRELRNGKRSKCD